MAAGRTTMSTLPRRQRTTTPGREVDGIIPKGDLHIGSGPYENHRNRHGGHVEHAGYSRDEPSMVVFRLEAATDCGAEKHRVEHKGHFHDKEDCLSVDLCMAAGDACDRGAMTSCRHWERGRYRCTRKVETRKSLPLAVGTALGAARRPMPREAHRA
eukprot:585017-Prymnesium_polylepis.2